jgi:recombinational DNA repair protein (RecF pathway)
VVLDIRPHGETGVVVTLLTEEHGRHAGFARGGASRAQAALWQPGNLVEAKWVGRLADQLGAVSAEMVHAAAALAMVNAVGLAEEWQNKPAQETERVAHTRAVLRAILTAPGVYPHLAAHRWEQAANAIYTSTEEDEERGLFLATVGDLFGIPVTLTEETLPDTATPTG